MFKNTADQKIRVFSFNYSTGSPVLGDAANMSCKISKDYSVPTPLNDTTPVEVEDGYYYFDLTQEETNADIIDFYPESTTPNASIIVPNHHRETIRNPYLAYGPAGTGTGMDAIILMTRGIIGDFGPTYTYSDERIQQVLTAAGLYLTSITSFADTYIIDMSGGTITPDPLNDNSFIVLCAWKTACMISTYELRNSSGIVMKDGPSMIDTKGTSQNMKAGMASICETFDSMMLDYLVNGGLSGTGGVGAAILGPYSPGSDYAHGNPSNRETGWR